MDLGNKWVLCYSRLHIQFDDESPGLGEADELVQGDAGHGLAGDGGHEGGGEEGGGQQLGVALVGPVDGDGVEGGHGVADGVVDEGDQLRSARQLEAAVDEGEVAEDGVHRHHPPAHGRHHHRVHPWTTELKNTNIRVLLNFDIESQSLLQTYLSY